MSSALDKSLDDIAGARRNTRKPRARRAAAVAGGVSKAPAVAPKVRNPRAAAVAVSRPISSQPARESKIAVGNLPDDVTEQQIKEFFANTVGEVKRVLLNYNKVGRSTGTGTIIFRHADSAAIAAKTYNGVLVDKRPMRIELILDAQSIPTAPATKSLKDRIANGPKKTNAKPKATANGKSTGTGTPGGAATKGERKTGRVRRPKKTAEELDAEMADYFDPNATAAPVAGGSANAAPAATAAAGVNGGETAMVEDEIM